MSNPCINRWGLNAFWHHSWYSDIRYAANLQHDAAVLQLVQIYLAYGSSAHTKFFWNPFWFKKGSKPKALPVKDYYRWTSVYNETLQSLSTYRMRVTNEEVFQTRVNVLKFDAWFIINFYWFQPDKDKKKRARRAKLTHYTSSEFSSVRTFSNVTKVKTLLESQSLAPRTRSYQF